MNQKFSTKLPPCSEWSLWLGEEIEGHSQLGTVTLFVRRIPYSITLDYFKDAAKQGITRVWFCKEFNDWPCLLAIARLFPYRCLEATMFSLTAIPESVRSQVRLYLKVPVQLRAGDHVCVGPAFADESFEIGTGKKVAPSEYEKDKLIL